MKKTICDKCGKELRDDEAIEMYIDGAGNIDKEYFDLCPECREKLIDWLAGSCPCKKQAETAHVAPAKKKPAKKLPSGWTVQALAAEMGRSRSHVQHALGELSPKPERKRVRDSKTHWWYEYCLTPAQFTELKKRFGGAK